MAPNLQFATLRLYVFFLNFMIWLLGLVILGLSIYVCLNKSNTPEVLGNYLFNASAYVALFSSVFIIILPVWCHIVIKRHSRFSLIIYIAALAILFLMTLCGAISILVFPAPLQSAVIAEMNRTLFKDYGKKGFITDSWNFVQSHLRCCAVEDNGWQAYRGSWWDLSTNAYFYNTNSQLPGTSGLTAHPFYRNQLILQTCTRVLLFYDSGPFNREANKHFS
uniref:Tetraspanin n=1 Tax=Mesocestoides corti TaxID=53468 RepID=A0A5K3EVV2_MESCO